MFHERPVPKKTDQEGGDKKGQGVQQKLSDHVSASLGIYNVFNHLLHVDIFFLNRY
jgi:hypothetical protein